MAKELDVFPGGPTRGKYPWEDWLNGNPWELEPGEDFDIDLASMRAVASRAAKHAGKKLRSRVLHREGKPDALVIQAY